jgi:exodeoxyribonuclease III
VKPTEKLSSHFALRLASRQRLALEQARQKYYYDLKRKDTHYKINQRVYVRREINKKNKKFLPKFVGPAIIKRQLGPSSYLVKVPHRKGTKLMKYHVHRMKAYYTRPSHLQLPPPQAQLPCLSPNTVNVIQPKTLSLCTWNVNGLRSLRRKNAHSFIVENNFDAVLLQESKCRPAVVTHTFSKHGFTCFSIPSQSNVGYAGVAIITKHLPLRVAIGFDNTVQEHARVLTLFFEHFILVSVYAPYSGFHLERLSVKIDWFQQFLQFVRSLQTNNLPIIIAGDLNVAAQPCDIHPLEERISVASATSIERSLFKELLSLGFVDSFRALHPTSEHSYSFWGFHPRHLYDNVGIRLDYFLVSSNISSCITHASIAEDTPGSDHAPCLLSLTTPTPTQ